MNKKFCFTVLFACFTFYFIFAATGDQTASIEPKNGVGATIFSFTEDQQVPASPSFGGDEKNKLLTFYAAIENPNSKSSDSDKSYFNDSSYTPTFWDLTIEPYASDNGQNGFYFFHETNKTIKVNYTLDCVAYKGTYDKSYVNDATKQASGPTTYTFKLDDVTNQYTLHFKGINYFKSTYGTIRAKEMWMYDIFLVMSDVDTSELEEGYYYSFFKVNLKVEGNATLHCPDGGLDINNAIYCIRAYYGIDSEGLSYEIFTVEPKEKAYNIDLDDPEFQKVMSVYFNTAESHASDYTMNNNDKTRYKIYFSSTNNLSEGRFKFRQIGSEHLTEDMDVNAIYYNLGISVDGSDVKAFPSSHQTSDKTLSKTQGYNVNDNKQPYVVPFIEDVALRHSYHSIQWSLKCDIWVKIDGDSENLNAGLYESYIYVILETNS